MQVFCVLGNRHDLQVTSSFQGSHVYMKEFWPAWTPTSPRFFFFLSKYKVNTNGLLSFGMPRSSYLSSSLPLANLPLVAPFWGDVDTRGSGEVFFRQTNNQSLLASVGTQIQMSFMDSLQFLPTSLFIATWINVGYYDMHTELVRFLWYVTNRKLFKYFTMTFSSQNHTDQHISGYLGNKWNKIICPFSIYWPTVGPCWSSHWHKQ